jgi:hypothetical protein
MKETPKTQQAVKKKQRSLRKNASLESTFFFRSIPLQRKSHGGEENFVIREISLQTNNNTSERTKERREQNRKSWHTWPPLSILLRFWCFPFRRRRRLVEEGGGGAKEAPIIR